MILSKNDCEQFFTIFDALTDFANGKWGVAPAVIDPRSGFVNEENQRKVASEIWRNTNIIDEFVKDTSYGLTPDELKIAKTWKCAFTDSFFAVQPEPRVTYLMNSDAAFKVTGLSREIVSMLNSIPAHVTATLLPFKSSVVYAVYLEETPLLMGQGILDAIDCDWQRLKDSHAIVETGQELVAATADLEEKRISHEAERMLNSLKADMVPDEPAEGSHRGVLAGLSAKERERLAEENACIYPDGDAAIRALQPYCLRGAPENSLVVLLMESKRDEMLSMLRSMGIKGVSSKNKAGLTQVIIESMLATHALEDLLSSMDPGDYEVVRNLYQSGGRIIIPADQVCGPERFCSCLPLLSYPYLVDGEFVFVMPDETYEACKAVDWGTTDANQREVKLAISTANFMVELRGAVPLVDVFDQYVALSQNPFEMSDLAMALTYSPRSDLALYDFWFGEAPGESYLVHADIAAAFSDEATEDRVHFGGLPVEIDDLFAVQEGKQPRPISEEMATVGEYVPWARTRPAAVALRDYLDAHVPDDANDYTYADRVTDDLIVMCTSEFAMKNITDYLSQELVLSGVDQLSRVMELFTNLSNSLPKWSNNGWSPNELLEGAGSGKVFYNEDGSIKRVGPHDSCPCGSGKKYKDCHGK